MGRAPKRKKKKEHKKLSYEFSFSYDSVNEPRDKTSKGRVTTKLKSFCIPWHEPPLHLLMAELKQITAESIVDWVPQSEPFSPTIKIM